MEFPWKNYINLNRITILQNRIDNMERYKLQVKLDRFDGMAQSH